VEVFKRQKRTGDDNKFDGKRRIQNSFTRCPRKRKERVLELFHVLQKDRISSETKNARVFILREDTRTEKATRKAFAEDLFALRNIICNISE
jgi:hypothetical protein